MRRISDLSTGKAIQRSRSSHVHSVQSMGVQDLQEVIVLGRDTGTSSNGVVGSVNSFAQFRSIHLLHAAHAAQEDGSLKHVACEMPCK